MSPATLQPSNVSSSESKKKTRKRIHLVKSKKRKMEIEEKLEWPKDMVLRLLELCKDERFVKKIQSKLTTNKKSNLVIVCISKEKLL